MTSNRRLQRIIRDRMIRDNVAYMEARRRVLTEQASEVKPDANRPE